MDTTLTDPLVERVLDGRYVVEARIARGGMASVYLATDRRLDRRVAVKVMHPALAEDQEFVGRFIREAHAAARMSHPDVVAVYDQGADDGHVFLVMEYVAGATLRDVLRDRGRLSPGEALAVMDHVLAALGAAHQAGLVHRDVKPENVLVTPDGRVKVADFGLARAVAETTLTGTGGMLIGTVAYLSPEQVERGVSDARSDVYSAGVLLYELLTGTTPFGGDTQIAIAYQRVTTPVPPPSEVVPGLPPELDALVASATAIDPDARPADAARLHAELRRVRDQLDLHDRVPPVPVATALTTRVPTDVTAAIPQHHTAVVPPGPAAPPEAAEAVEERRRRRRWPIILLVLALLSTGAAVAGWWLAEGRYVTVPGVAGLSPEAAQKRLAAEGLKVSRLPDVYSDTVKAGLIVSQHPAPSSDILRGGTVKIAVSRGPETRKVPDVLGKSLDVAKQMITGQRFRIGGTSEEFSESVPSGAVIRTDPEPGKVLRVGTVVSLVVSKGPPPVTVPNVTGMALQEATARLTSSGFRVTTTEAFDDKVKKGSVISQSPSGGTAPKGSTVALVVSKGPQLFKVPDVVGKKVKDAERILEAAGFKTKVDAFPGGPGRVLRQDPGAGDMKPKGTTVKLYVF